ncbi:hypothetical protein [Leclercia adecarboxylata]|uniref:hypothetical protein n=1 Tax=Leclercia adecarboxylata TaxID=83655 RepID=UPI00301A8878
MINPPSDKTTRLFKPFLKLQKAKKKLLTESQYIKLVDKCLSSFYGEEKLSPNRKMWNYSSIIVYIYYEIDSDLLFEKFTQSFKITSKNRDDFLKHFLSKLKAPFTEKKKAEILRVFSLVNNRINTERKIIEIYKEVKDIVDDAEEMFAAIESMKIKADVKYSDIDNEQPIKKRRL